MLLDISQFCGATGALWSGLRVGFKATVDPSSHVLIFARDDPQSQL